MKTIIKLLTLITFFFLMNTMAYGHKVRVFAYGEGDSIMGETSFNGGRSPKEVEILVQNGADGSSLLTTRTDAQGRFTFPIPEVARKNYLDLRIIVNVGEGHRNEWLLEAAEYLPDAPAGAPAAMLVEQVVEHVSSQGTKLQIGAIDEKLLRQIVEESIAKQLGPVKHMLAENRERKVSLQDILGGIGYIIGLAGLAAYLKTKKGDTA